MRSASDCVKAWLPRVRSALSCLFTVSLPRNRQQACERASSGQKIFSGSPWLSAKTPTNAATMANPQRPRVFLDINVGEQPAGRLVIELFTEHVPRTSEKFVAPSVDRPQPAALYADDLTAFVSYAPANMVACHMRRRRYIGSSTSS
jgi:hypothetical protein